MFLQLRLTLWAFEVSKKSLKIDTFPPYLCFVLLLALNLVLGRDLGN